VHPRGGRNWRLRLLLRPANGSPCPETRGRSWVSHHLLVLSVSV